MVHEYTAGRPSRKIVTGAPRQPAARAVAIVLFLATLQVAGCAPIPGTTSSSSARAGAPESRPIAMLLAQAGYVGIPFRWDRRYPIVEAIVGTTPVTLILD